jgi:hypothetical protein
VSVGGKWYYKVRNDQADALRQKAIFDPDLAQSLAKVMGKDGVKDGPITHKEMMDLKKMAFANGIMIGSHQVQSQATLQERQKRGEAHRDYDEGRDKWRRSTSSPLY